LGITRLHYVAFDLLAGNHVAQDAMKIGMNKALTTVCLFFTLMLGPAGIVLYGIARLAVKADTKFIPWIALWD
jgi:hypothetical protein